jgi:3-deoxy-D-manno-octulosonate 8-phosphate phosphatase KdsC-like HAD superfamily phosphatase
VNEIKLMVLDVDGVLTDGKLYIGSDGEEYKSFHTQLTSAWHLSSGEKVDFLVSLRNRLL